MLYFVAVVEYEREAESLELNPSRTRKYEMNYFILSFYITIAIFLSCYIILIHNFSYTFQI